MIFGDNPIVDTTTVENAGANTGAMVGSNCGTIIINGGLGFNDTKALCQDIIRDELAKYAQEAYTEAENRSEELFERVVAELDERKMTDTQALSVFSDPAMQFDYFEAQKAYMKVGTPELADILSHIIADRAGESKRTLLQITLGEAINVAPKLVETQMCTLSLVFMIKHVQVTNIYSYEDLAEHIRTRILPIYQKGISKKESEFQHLNFTGCSQYTTTSPSLSNYYQFPYPGLFMKGIARDDLPKDANGVNFADRYPDLFVKCLNNDQLLQLWCMSEADLQTTMTKLSIEKEHREIIHNLFTSNTMHRQEVQDLIIKLVPEMQELFDYWKDCQISDLALSSVGIVLGAQYAQMITGEQYDLTIWI